MNCIFPTCPSSFHEIVKLKRHLRRNHNVFLQENYLHDLDEESSSDGNDIQVEIGAYNSEGEGI